MTSTDVTHEPVAHRQMSITEIRSVYAEQADWIYRMEWLDRRLTGRYRRQLFAAANGRVLDVACGTGPNFRYLPEMVDLTGIDVSPEMLAKARQPRPGVTVLPDGRGQWMSSSLVAHIPVRRGVIGVRTASGRA